MRQPSVRLTTFNRPTGLAAAFNLPTALLQRTFGTLLAWDARARQRHSLAELSDHLLRDIGIERGAARREAEKPFWRP